MLCHQLPLLTLLVDVWVPLHRVVPVHQHPLTQSVFPQRVYLVLFQATEVRWQAKLVFKDACVNEVYWVWGLFLLILIKYIQCEGGIDLSVDSQNKLFLLFSVEIFSFFGIRDGDMIGVKKQQTLLIIFFLNVVVFDWEILTSFNTQAF